MGFSIETSVSVFTVFFQGILSFFSPCVLPLLPVYMSYLAGGAKTVDENGIIHYPKKRVIINTLFFVLGISFTFFALGLGITSLGQFFNESRIWFARISGMIMVLFGLYQLGIFGKSKVIGNEHRLPFMLDKKNMNAITALLLGFTFSFAWTPCVGPTLGSVLLMAGSTGSTGKGLVLIGVYTLGFVIPFLLVGLFTGTVLDFFKKHNKVVKYTVKIGAALLIFMGIMTLTGFMNGFTDYLSRIGQPQSNNTSSEQPISSNSPSSAISSDTVSEDTSSTATDVIPAPDFTLTDQFGNKHTLSDYKGKTVFLNFWATWCPPCKEEMPHIQELYEKYDKNKGDLIILGVAQPNVDREGDIGHIKQFLIDNKYDFPVVLDEDNAAFGGYSIRAYPTTFMIDKDGNVFGYVESGITADVMESIIKQTMEGKREDN